MDMFDDARRSGQLASMSIINRSIPMLAATAALGLSAAPALAQSSHHRTDRAHGSGQKHSGYGSQNGASRAVGLDRAWLKHVAQADLAEIATGTLAQQKGTSDGVKSLAAMLIADHTKHLQLVQALASQVGATVPTAPSPEQQWEASVLGTFSGAAFDQQWIALQIGAHLTNIDKTQDEIADGRNEAVRSLAEMTLPTLQAHLAAAQKLAGTANTTGTDTTTTGAGTHMQSDCNGSSGNDSSGSDGSGSGYGNDDRSRADGSSDSRNDRQGNGCCHDGSGSSSDNAAAARS
jgi:predicted outer membrane protein